MSHTPVTPAATGVVGLPQAVASSVARALTPERTPTFEVVGASDKTIGEAVRRALARAAKSLRTLDGAGVLVIPQIARGDSAPRFRVTLQITAPDSSCAASHHSQTS
jgi:flavin-binding protein dodecin